MVIINSKKSNLFQESGCTGPGLCMFLIHLKEPESFVREESCFILNLYFYLADQLKVSYSYKKVTVYICLSSVHICKHSVVLMAFGFRYGNSDEGCQ